VTCQRQVPRAGRPKAPGRNLTRRFFGWLKRATRCDKRADDSLAAINIFAAGIWSLACGSPA